jgi:hypothetical protein
VLEAKRGAGVLFNARDKTAKANLQLDRKNAWRDGNGLVFIPLYVLAKQGINPGEGGYWRYDPFSGIGGAESYTFNDEKYGIGWAVSSLSTNGGWQEKRTFRAGTTPKADAGLPASSSGSSQEDRIAV